jgi:hypothetical protein
LEIEISFSKAQLIPLTEERWLMELMLMVLFLLIELIMLEMFSELYLFIGWFWYLPS